MIVGGHSSFKEIEVTIVVIVLVKEIWACTLMVAISQEHATTNDAHK